MVTLNVTLNRRSFLNKAAAGTAGAVALTALGRLGQSASAATMGLNQLTLAHFSPLVGKPMSLYAGASTLSVKLDKAEAAGAAAKALKTTTTTTTTTTSSTTSNGFQNIPRRLPWLPSPTPTATTTSSTTTSAANAVRPFSLLFKGPASPVLPDKIYGLEHPQLGRLDFYLTRIGDNKQGPVYEAIFG